MKDFKLGDFVRFVDENREGYITRIIDEHIVGVTGEDDFEIPVAISNLAKVHGHYYDDLEDKALAIPAVSPEKFVKTGIYIALLPDANKASLAQFYLVNQTSFELLFALSSENKGGFKGEFSGQVAPLSALKVYTASFPDLELWPKFNFRILTFTKADVQTPKPLDSWLKFKAKDFSGSKEHIALIDKAGWKFQLDEEELKIDAQKLRESFFRPSEEKQALEKPAKEVDLHIEKLREDYAFLNKGEILDFQIKSFEKNLEAAIAHKYPDIIFIHGLGNGTLKNHIHKAAGRHPQVQTFKDARKEKFGYGATHIFLK